MRPIAIFRFSPTEGPAHFAEWLDRVALPWTLIAIDEADPVPADPSRFSGIGMMGGPMSATDALPWVEPLSALLRESVARNIPIIGHCLGGQLLAQALGARVQRTHTPVIGWIDVEATDSAAQRDWFGGHERFTPFQWHYDVFELPPRAVRVLTNRFNPNQGYVIDDAHIGFQCHIEMTQDLVETWCRTGADEIAGPATPGRQSREQILDDMPARLHALHLVTDGIYARWSQRLVR